MAHSLLIAGEHAPAVEGAKCWFPGFDHVHQLLRRRGSRSHPGLSGQCVAHLQCTELIVRHVGKQGRLSSTGGALCVLRRRQPRLLRCFGTKRGFPKFWYTVAVDAIEKNGGPSLLDRVAPATWLIERALKGRWTRCID